MAVIDVISANLPVLRELRDRMGQLELAERVGVSRRTIARLENAEVTDPGVDLMGRIGKELGVSLAVMTESEVEPVWLALPKDVVERLASEEAPEMLDAMIRAARHPRSR
jgi:transcriptional regulator with XRE-family HTH domain